jgi:phage host-nuclease inhibitor protein Gam
MALVAALTVQLQEEVSAQNGKLLLAREHDKKILDLKERISRHGSRLEGWAKANRTALFGEAQSLELRQGTIGFRLSNRGVKLLEGWTDASVIERLLKLPETFHQYVRIKRELDRQRVLADSRPEAERLSERDLAKFGVGIGRSESFFMEAKVESLQAVRE